MKIILGGPSVAHFAKNTEEILQQYYVDAIYLGEGENALVEYLRAVDQKSGRMLPGVAYKNREKIVLALPFHYNKKLDDLPFPDFSGLNLSAYNAVTRFPSYTSRGCPNKCFYCSDRNFFDGLRIRSAKRLIEEFEYIKKKYPRIREMRFFDSISNAKMCVLEKFCDIKIRNGPDLKFNLENAVIRKKCDFRSERN